MCPAADSFETFPSCQVRLFERVEDRIRYFSVSIAIAPEYSLWRWVQRHEAGAWLPCLGNHNLLA